MQHVRSAYLFLFIYVIAQGHVKKYPGLSSVAEWQQKKKRAGGLFFTELHLVGARKKYAQTRSTVVWYNIFNAITLFINITIYKKSCVYTHVCISCQYEFVFSKWPTFVKISRRTDRRK
jgi:hypothetical protein